MSTEVRTRDDKYSIQQMNILLVDDDEQVLDTVFRILKLDGHTIYKANGHVQATAIWDSHKDDIDLIISDIVMPEVNGIDLVDKLLENTAKNVVVLFISGFTYNYLEDRGISYNDINFIAKPFSISELKNKIKDITK